MPHSAIKLGVEGDQGVVTSKWLLLRDWLGMGLPVGGGEWLPVHRLFCYFFPWLSKLSLSGPTSFLTFVLPVLSLVPLRQNEQAAVRCLAAGWVNAPQARMPSSHNALLHLRLMSAPHIIFYFLSMRSHRSHAQCSRKPQSLWNRGWAKSQDAPVGKLFHVLFLLKAKEMSRYIKVWSSKAWTFWETTQVNLASG